MFIAMTIFILSDAEEINITGTLEILRISPHQWYPLKKGSPISIRTRCGAYSANAVMIFRKSLTHSASSPHSSACSLTACAIPSSSSTIKIRYTVIRLSIFYQTKSVPKRI